jgi:hypothetical protein
LENNRSNGKEMRVGGKSKRNRAELRGEGEPCNSTIRKEEMAASAGRGRRFEGRIIDREARQRTKTKRKISEEGMSRVGSGGRGKRRRSDEDRSNMGDTFQRVVRVEDSSVIGGGASCAVGEEKLKGKGEVLGDESIVIMASKAIDISHHSSWAMEDLEEVTKEFLGPAADLMNGAIILQNFFDSTAVAEPKELGRQNRGKRGRSSSNRNWGSESNRGLLQFAKDGLCDELFLGTDKNERANGSDADRAKGSKLG